ncbi:hypothetical protein SNE510_72280 [Streptomyces sp. NE5-10]|uniref:Uncharacterized protein n=1 Tax=Streptomyces hydrogenans TaxID=1873719 RepID=A0ABQ3PDX8_9ACTN|nr:hypothetical protein GCM10018784_73090 [Streptomyces hydrogenans]GHI23230.1 hypothetical protein Shyd_46010 [Streptomyces hydrogenans]GHJ97709.1 hypothetical protein SNE510_72280 [Streptomyces sp. NE5-10]
MPVCSRTSARITRAHSARSVTSATARTIRLRQKARRGRYRHCLRSAARANDGSSPSRTGTWLSTAGGPAWDGRDTAGGADDSEDGVDGGRGDDTTRP